MTVCFVLFAHVVVLLPVLPVCAYASGETRTLEASSPVYIVDREYRSIETNAPLEPVFIEKADVASRAGS